MFSSLLAAVLAPLALGAPSAHNGLNRRDDLCHLSEPPALCEPDPTVTVEETAQRAYDFYRAFILDGDPETMFSLIDSVYEVKPSPNPHTARQLLTMGLAT